MNTNYKYHDTDYNYTNIKMDTIVLELYELYFLWHLSLKHYRVAFDNDAVPTLIDVAQNYPHPFITIEEYFKGR